MLMIREGSSPRQQWALQGAAIVIGRGDDCHVIINDRQASRHHARVTQTQDGYVLEDLGSKNGTFLNGQPLTIPTVLKDGDEIAIREGSRDLTYFKDLNAVAEARTIPEWLQRDTTKMVGIVQRLPERVEIDGSLNEQLIVEYYSRR